MSLLPEEHNILKYVISRYLSWQPFLEYMSLNRNLKGQIAMIFAEASKSSSKNLVFNTGKFILVIDGDGIATPTRCEIFSKSGLQ